MILSRNIYGQYIHRYNAIASKRRVLLSTRVPEDSDIIARANPTVHVVLARYLHCVAIYSLLPTTWYTHYILGIHDWIVVDLGDKIRNHAGTQ